jgi:dCMP deaminase
VGVHAEQNALLQAGRDAEGATLYVNAFPCKICAKLIINAGIKRVVMSGDYSDKEGLEYLRRAKVELKFIVQKEKRNSIYNDKGD